MSRTRRVVAGGARGFVFCRRAAHAPTHLKLPGVRCGSSASSYHLLSWALALQVVPVLRAGLVLLEQAASVIPVSETYHVGYVRDDETLLVRF